MTKLKMVLNKSLKNIKFINEVNKFFKENKDKILDIILFGSTVKGKDEPKDIDLLILFKERKDLDLSYKLRKQIEKKDLGVHVTSLNYYELFSPGFKAREAILSEGYSLIQKKFLSECFGYNNLVLFRYELRNFNKSNRMRFYYSLYGRNGKGMLEKLNAIKFSETILLCPVMNENKMEKYLDAWKIKYIKLPILIPERFERMIRQ